MDFYQILTGQNVKRPIWAPNSSYILPGAGSLRPNFNVCLDLVQVSVSRIWSVPCLGVVLVVPVGCALRNP
jgi:hypothetical protein